MYFHETSFSPYLAPLPFYQKIAVGALSGKAEAKILQKNNHRKTQQILQIIYFVKAQLGDAYVVIIVMFQEAITITLFLIDLISEFRWSNW